MAANNVEKKHRVGSSPHLLTGLIFDSTGNRMSPTHTRKKGVRYRYYVSQAVTRCRKEEAGAVARVPAPDVEDMVSGLIATRFGAPGVASSREVLEAHVDKVTIQAEAVEVALRPTQKPGNRDSGPSQPLEIVSLPWTRQPFVATKGVAYAPSNQSAADPKARDNALAAIGKARLWLEEILAGGTFAEIAKREGKGERQIRLPLPLAFVPPATVRGLIDGTATVTGVTEMAKNMPLVWA
jgi:site-specific DNA recombinase